MQSPQPNIEPLTLADYQEVIDFWNQTPGVGLSEGDDLPSYTAFLQRNPGMSLVIRHQGRIIAAIMCGHDGRRGYLYHLAVAPDHRQQGLGRLLVQHCMEKLHQAGIHRASIFIFNHNTTGRQFWTRAGWKDRPDLLVMQRPTRPA
jgi:ribosomal protein S18 acetylase RimI-like enzyme